MPWLPSSLSSEAINPTFAALQGAFANAFPASGLNFDFRDKAKIGDLYIVERQGNSWTPSVREAMLGALPASWASYPTGYIEADVMDFIVNHPQNRMLSILGPRGVGKSTSIRYIAGVLGQECKNEPYHLAFFDGNTDSRNGDGEFNEKWWPTFLRKFLQEAERIAVCEERHDRPADAAAIRQSLAPIAKKGASEAAFFDTCGMLLTGHSANHTCWLTLVFDNLDPLPNATITEMYSFCLRLKASTGMGTILTMRPSSYENVQSRLGCRTARPFRVRIRPPAAAAILARVPKRLEAYAAANYMVAPPHIDGQPVTPALAHAIGERLIRLIEAGHPMREFRQVMKFFDAVSSEDMRHLAVLFNRMVANHKLPPLLSADSDQQRAADFHPVTAAIYGSHTLYERNEYVANLLFTPDARGEAQFLLAHRILAVIRAQRPATGLAEIHGFLAACGVVDADEIVKTMNRLRIANLIYGTDLDKNWDSLHQPDACGLTQAGLYYLNSLLRDPDYLLAVVHDTPLDHRRVRAERDASTADFFEPSFAASASSLIEYYTEILAREHRDLRAMKSERNPDSRLAYAVDCLRHGSSLSACVQAGLTTLATRTMRSRSPGVASVAQEIHSALERHRSSQDSLAQGYEEVLDRCERQTSRQRGPVPMGGGCPIVGPGAAKVGRVEVRPFGLDCDVRVLLESNLTFEPTAVQISGPGGEGAFTIAISVSDDSPYEGDWQKVSREVVCLWGNVPAVRLLIAPPVARRFARSPRGALGPSVPLDGGDSGDLGPHSLGPSAMQLYLNYQGYDSAYRRVPITREFDPGAIAHAITPMMAHLQEALAQAGADHAVMRRAIGRKLANMVIPDGSMLKNAGQIRGLRRTILSYPHGAIPWDWLALDPDDASLSLQTVTQLLRFAPAGNTCATMSTSMLGQPSQKIETLGTHVCPKHSTEVWEWLRQPGVRHLVCETTQPDTLLFRGASGSVVLSLYELGGLRPLAAEGGGPSGIVISGCSFASSENASLIASTFRCPVIAPLCNIWVRHAEEAASVLAAGIQQSPESPLVDVFHHSLAASETLRLYTVLLPWTKQ